MATIQELIVDAYGCEADLSDTKKLEKVARQAVTAIGASIAEVTCYKFQPHGITLCLILKESHFVLSTWPEHGLAIVNIFLCNPEMDTMECWKYVEQALKPESCVFHKVKHTLSSKKPKAALKVVKKVA